MRPDVILFDVNETLSDMSPMADRFADVGAPPDLAATWFAGLLRDGFALTTTGANPAFADLAADSLRRVLAGVGVDDPGAAADQVMAGFSELAVHPDVIDGIEALGSDGYRLATLSNGSTAVADTLLTGAGIRDAFTSLLSVEAAPAWKPHRSSYEYAADALRVEPARVVLVAVHPWDLHGAHEAGLGTAWINRGGADYPSYFARPDHTVTALAELATSLRA